MAYKPWSQGRRMSWKRYVVANRLFVQKIVSIGLVNKGDNELAEVVIFKARNTETVTEWSAHTNRRLADVRKTLEDLNKRIENQRPSRLATIPERTNPMTMTEKETPQDLNGLVIAKLDAYARREQFEGEIAGRYGYLSTPREEMVTKIRAKWWATPDGQAVKDLVRERGGDPADLTTIQKDHSEAYAAIGRLDG